MSYQIQTLGLFYAATTWEVLALVVMECEGDQLSECGCCSPFGPGLCRTQENVGVQEKREQLVIRFFLKMEEGNSRGKTDQVCQ